MLVSLESLAGNLNIGEIPVVNTALTEHSVQCYGRGLLVPRAALSVHTNADRRNSE